MLTDGTPYEDLGADWFDKQSDRDAETRRLVRRLETLSHTVTITQAA
jgi:hypothetical protein